jgi:hypothetical protein
LTGGYTRVLLDVTLILGGSCKINDRSFPSSFVAKAVFQPSGTPGLNQSVTAATYTAAFTISPA